MIDSKEAKKLEDKVRELREENKAAAAERLRFLIANKGNRLLSFNETSL